MCGAECMNVFQLCNVFGATSLRLLFYELSFCVLFFFLSPEMSEVRVLNWGCDEFVFFKDYFDIIKKPMDLSTIKRKLDTGQYQDPWQYVDDVWLMFDNAWLYNRKTSRVYRYCTKVLNDEGQLELRT